MLNLGLISFATPWVLAAAAALPLVWLLLRLTPPAVKQINFPAVRLLFGLDPTRRTTTHTPPWLVILRIAILTLVLLGLADPVLNLRQSLDSEGPVVVVVDNGWASANQWDSRLTALREVLDSASRRNQQVALLTTAPLASATFTPRLQAAREALKQMNQIAPQPWATNRAETVRELSALNLRAPASSVWISDGVESEGAGELGKALAALGPLTVIEADADTAPVVQYPPERSASGREGSISNSVTLRLARAATGTSPQVVATVRAVDNTGQVLGRTMVTFPAGQSSGTATMSLPSELANRVSRFDVEGMASASTTVLADDQWQRRPVGIANASIDGISAPLLEDSYYIEQALAPFADIRAGTLDELLSRPLAVMVMTGGGRILEGEVGKLTSWIEGGGLLVRFAGPRLEGNVDPLLPVRLRSGGRTLGGTMSWSTPATLAPFPENSPFRGMVIPEDVTVSSQVIAEPGADLAAKTWARLRDGTPLVTAERHGQGWVVLFHVTATPEWSKLPLSGLFMDMLRRLVDISRGVPAEAPDEAVRGNLAPLSVLDGLGRLSTPGPLTVPINARDIAETIPSPKTPPGLYGPTGATRALNLGPSLGDIEALSSLPSGAIRGSFAAAARERTLKPILLTLALILLLADLVISFVLRHLVPESIRLSRVGAATSIALAVLILVPTPGRAADAPRPAAARPANDIDPVIRAAVLESRIAYIATGANDIDRMVQSGVDALTELLGKRTAVQLAPPVRIDLTAPTMSTDVLIPFPLIYWRITATTPVPPAKGLTALNTYLQRGGMVVFDAPDQAGAVGGGGAGATRARLEAILRSLDLPPVTPVANDHVLNRSFYLLQTLPGRYVGTEVLVESGSSALDGASSVIISGNDWAGAWARDNNGQPMYATVPGGERQRELAYRVGINMVMYALTGNYKTDQVHLPAILERLAQ